MAWNDEPGLGEVGASNYAKSTCLVLCLTASSILVSISGILELSCSLEEVQTGLSHFLSMSYDAYDARVKYPSSDWLSMDTVVFKKVNGWRLPTSAHQGNTIMR